MAFSDTYQYNFTDRYKLGDGLLSAIDQACKILHRYYKIGFRPV